jgi:hypothetical protein
MIRPDDKWLEWQRDHAEALAALQEAQRAYHRTVVAAAGPPSREALRRGLAEAPSNADVGAEAGQQSAVASPQAESLKAVDAARARLDAVRARKPE